MMNHVSMGTAVGVFLALTTLPRAAVLEFKEPLKEVHASVEAKSVTADFEFTNRTSKAVEVVKCESTCTCVRVAIKGGKLRYAPGESGLIRAEFDIGNFSGTVDKMIALWVDDDPDPKPSMSLTVRTHIPVLVSLEPKSVKWDIHDKAEPKSVKITMNHTKPIQVVSVSCTSEGFKHELKTIEAGKRYELVVTPLAPGVREFGRFAIVTDSEIARYRSQQVFATVSQAAPAAAPLKP